MELDSLLTDLYCIYSPSSKETDMIEFIKKEISNQALYGEISLETDAKNNMYITKGVPQAEDNYPCVVAHLDQVQPTALDKVIKINDQIIGWNSSNLSQNGLGADDKNGIWCALNLLQKYSVIKVAFFVEEETGCIGSNNCNLSFFNDVKFILQADRKGKSDIIFTASGVNMVSDIFKTKVTEIGKKYEYSDAVGSLTDVRALVVQGVGVSCINISCGYYNPHTQTEYTLFSELQNCLNFMSEIIEQLTDSKYEHIYKSSSFSNYYGDSSWGYSKYYSTPNKKSATKTTVNNSISLPSYDESKFKEAKKLLKNLNKYKTVPDLYTVYTVYKNSFTYLTLSDFIAIYTFYLNGFDDTYIK